MGRKSGDLKPRTLGRQTIPKCPVQLCNPANQVPPGTVWTGDVPQTWLEEPDIPEEERMAAAINHKLRLGQ